jgi:hypothetical protein
MLDFRQFDAGPDPFGRKFHVYFKWIQNAISMRHADDVDVKFVLEDESGACAEKRIAMPHPVLLRVSRELGRPMDDAWCSRLAQRHLLHLIETGEDMEKDFVTASYQDLKRYAEELARAEQSEAHAH